jgi:Icc protein
MLIFLISGSQFMMNAPLRIVQISDIHHFASKDKTLLGVNTHDSFCALLDLLKKESKQPDFILLTGDLSQDGSEISYIQVSDLIKSFPVPAYWVPGNHDDSNMMAHVFPRDTISNQKHIVLDKWHIILLDSHIQGRVEGHLSTSQLTFLQQCLESYPKHHAIIVFHHQPIPVGSAWLDKLGINNADALWDVLKQFQNVHTILFGHVHQQHEGKKNNINYFSLPSTCIQFKTNSEPFALEKLPPGYRWVDLYPNGELKTGVTRLADYVGFFDSDAKGY